MNVKQFNEIQSLIFELKDIKKKLEQLEDKAIDIFGEELKKIERKKYDKGNKRAKK